MNVLITGVTPGSGIGFETAQRLVAEGHCVYAGVHTEEQLHKAHGLPDADDIFFFKLDVDDPVDRELAGTLDVDCYFGIAGIGVSGSLAEIDMDRVRQAFETNVFSMFEVAQQVLPGMIEKGKGRLIFTSSLSSYLPLRFFGVYTATKATIAMFGNALRQEMKMLDADIDVSVIMPGAYHTGFNQTIIDSKADWMREESLFKDELDTILKQEHCVFKAMEKGSLDSLMPAIMHATTASRPRARYQAPLSHALGARAVNHWKCCLACGAVLALGITGILCAKKMTK